MQEAREKGTDLKARERVKEADIEAWLADQFRTGQAQSNPNFIPLTTDWRARVKARAAAEKESRAAAAAEADRVAKAASQVVLHYDSAPDLELLSTALPKGWAAMWDSSSGDVYYGNTETKVCARDVHAVLATRCSPLCLAAAQLCAFPAFFLCIWGTVHRVGGQGASSAAQQPCAAQHTHSLEAVLSLTWTAPRQKLPIHV